MKRIIYIDFENVSTAGLNGILDLNEKDHVKIFLGPKCSKLSLIEAEAILHCHATVELITNDQIGKNALDFIIMVHMGYDIAKKAGKAFYIISNDKGYEPAIHEMQSMTGLTIERLSDIRQVLNEEEPAKGGLFGLFGRKNKQVHNMTEHEVYEKGKRVGQAKRSTRSDAENRNNGGGDRQRNGRKSSGGEGGRNRNGQNRGAQNRNNSERNGGGQAKAGASQKPGNANRAGKQNTPAKPDALGKAEPQGKRDGQGKPEAVSSEQPVSRENQPSSRESQPSRERRAARRSTRKEEENRNLEDLSVAELAKELGIERNRKAAEPDAAAEFGTVSEPKAAEESRNAAKPKSAGEAKAAEMSADAAASMQERSVTALVKVPEPIVHVPAVTSPAMSVKKEKAKRPAPMNAEEKALVARAIEANEDKEAYHNYLMAELHDTQRATELYKLSKNRFLKAKENAKSMAKTAEDEDKKQQEEAVLLAADTLWLTEEKAEEAREKKQRYNGSTKVEKTSAPETAVVIETTESVAGGSESVHEKPGRSAGNLKVGAEKPEAVAEDPEVRAEKRKLVVEEPQARAEKPKAVVVESEVRAEKLEAVAEVSEAVIGKSEAVAEESKAVAVEPEVIVKKRKLVVEEPEAAAENLKVKAVAEEPEVIAENSEMVAEAVAKASEVIVKKPKAVAEEPEMVAKKPSAVRESEEAFAERLEAPQEAPAISISFDRIELEEEMMGEEAAQEESFGMELLM